MDVAKIVKQLFALVAAHDLASLRGMWAHLDHVLFQRLLQEVGGSALHVSRLETVVGSASLPRPSAPSAASLSGSAGNAGGLSTPSVGAGGGGAGSTVASSNLVGVPGGGSGSNSNMGAGHHHHHHHQLQHDLSGFDPFGFSKQVDLLYTFLLRHYLVVCLVAERRDKVVDFFAAMPHLADDAEWRAWFGTHARTHARTRRR